MSNFDSNTERILKSICEMVSAKAAIQLGPKQYDMVAGRLKRRFIELQIDKFDHYFDYLQSHLKDEMEILVSLLTTHHTYFFREFGQFEYLEKQLPTLVEKALARGDKTIRVWSAACSGGHEVYSLAMFLRYHLQQLGNKVSFEILGTDIDRESVALARNGVYRKKELNSAPLTYISDNWARGSGEIADFVKVKSQLKKHCQFDQLNLVDIKQKITGKKFDVIFCRNVFIYFSPSQIKSVTGDLVSCMYDHGYLFLGTSETLSGLELPLQSKGLSIYTVPSAQPEKRAVAAKSTERPVPAVVEPPALLRVLCVDDSKSIHTLMKQILTKEQGFEIVGHAMNGLEAAEMMAKYKPDCMTLDIHMPEQTGIEYLQKNFKSGHAPVVMVSSVSRETSDLAIRSLTLGASDYVEKPALNDLAERGDELRAKLRSAYRNWKTPVSLTLDKSFEKKTLIEHTDKKLRVVVGSLSHKRVVKFLMKEISQGQQPPTVFMLEGVGAALPEVAKKLSRELDVDFKVLEAADGKMKTNEKWICDVKNFSQVKQAYASAPTSILVLGNVSEFTQRRLREWKGAYFLFEDFEEKKLSKANREIAGDFVPVTSFGYLSNEWLAKKKAA